MIYRKKSKKVRKEVFVSLGEIKLVDGKKRFVPQSLRYLNDCINRLPVGKKIAAQFSEFRYMRSESQLRYHMVLCGYLAEHCGTTKLEMHDALMRLCFGVKWVRIGNRHIEVRKSLSDEGDTEKFEAVELVTYDLERCRELEIVVPSAQELGYLPS